MKASASAEVKEDLYQQKQALVSRHAGSRWWSRNLTSSQLNESQPSVWTTRIDFFFFFPQIPPKHNLLLSNFCLSIPSVSLSLTMKVVPENFSQISNLFSLL